jgi:predicted DNA-binding transcriptional regulator AlpA
MRHHLDRRADAIIRDAKANKSPGDPDLFSTRELAKFLAVSEQFLEIGRHQGYGPPFVRIAPKMVRYRRVDVLRWLADRVHARTSEYQPQAQARREGRVSR